MAVMGEGGSGLCNVVVLLVVLVVHRKAGAGVSVEAMEARCIVRRGSVRVEMVVADYTTGRISILSACVSQHIRRRCCTLQGLLRTRVHH